MAKNLGIYIQIPISGFHFRYKPFWKINFRFERISPKCAELNFRWSLLKYFPCGKSFRYVKHADLGVIGPVEPLRSVTVKSPLMNLISQIVTETRFECIF